MSEPLLGRVRRTLAARAARPDRMEPTETVGAAGTAPGRSMAPRPGFGTMQPVSRPPVGSPVQRSDVPSAAQVAAALPPEGRLLGDTAARETVEELYREISAAGVLQPLLDLPAVTDVLVHGPREVMIDRGDGLEPAGVTFDDDAAVRRLAQRLAATVGRRLDDASPCVDARLPGGARFHAVLAPVSRHGTCISLRVSGSGPRSLDDLVDRTALPPEGAELLRRIVAARAAFLVTGGAGSGKTTLLGALLALVPANERIVLIEDSAELEPAHPHVVHLEGRPPNVEGAGGIDLRMLVRQALRMRPDRMVVGEARGAELIDLLVALNTGQAGGCGTVHANTAAELPARVEALCGLGGLDRAAAHSQLAAAVSAVVHVARGADRCRRIAEIAGLVPAANGLVVSRTAMRFTHLDDGGWETVEGPGFPVVMERLDNGVAR